ncbi:MAG: hypothetical protein WBR15_10865 [Gammaproteobacteria bacterium]
MDDDSLFIGGTSATSDTSASSDAVSTGIASSLGDVLLGYVADQATLSEESTAISDGLAPPPVTTSSSNTGLLLLLGLGVVVLIVVLKK